MPASEEYHVVSFVAHAAQSHIEEIKAQISQVEGTEIHAVSDEGKIVLTIEGRGQREIDQKLATFKYHDGLLTVSPVYHQFLPETENV